MGLTGWLGASRQRVFSLLQPSLVAITQQEAPVLLGALRACGAVAMLASRATMVPVAALTLAMAEHFSLRGLSAAAVLAAIPQGRVLSPACPVLGPGSFTQALPTILPEPQKAWLGSSRHYQLLEKPAALEASMGQMQGWFTSQVQLDRGRGECVSVTTFEQQYKKLAWQFLGFCHLYFSIPLPQLSLSLLLQPSLMAQFFSFLQARDVMGSSLINITSRLKRLVLYLASPSAGMQLVEPDEYVEWIASMGRQVSKAQSKRLVAEVSELVGQAALPPTFPQWVQWVDSKVKPLLEQLQAQYSQRWGVRGGGDGAWFSSLGYREACQQFRVPKTGVFTCPVLWCAVVCCVLWSACALLCCAVPCHAPGTYIEHACIMLLSFYALFHPHLSLSPPLLDLQG